MKDNRIWNLMVKMNAHSLFSRYGILALIVLKAFLANLQNAFIVNKLWIRKVFVTKLAELYRQGYSSIKVRLIHQMDKLCATWSVVGLKILKGNILQI